MMTLISPILLTETKSIGTRWLHVFNMDDGSVQKVDITQQQYQDLAKPNAGQPTIANGTWAYSYETPMFDTASGFIEDNHFWNDGTKCVIKLPSRTKLVRVLPTTLVGSTLPVGATDINGNLI